MEKIDPVQVIMLEYAARHPYLLGPTYFARALQRKGDRLTPEDRVMLADLVEQDLLSSRKSGAAHTYELTQDGFWLLLHLHFTDQLKLGMSLWFCREHYSRVHASMISKSPIPGHTLRGFRDEPALFHSAGAVRVFPHMPGTMQATMLGIWHDDELRWGEPCYSWREIQSQARTPILRRLAADFGYAQQLLLQDKQPVYDYGAVELLRLLTQGPASGLLGEDELAAALQGWRQRTGDKGFFPGGLTLVWLGLLHMTEAPLEPWQKPLTSWAKLQGRWFGGEIKGLLQWHSLQVGVVLHQIKPMLCAPANNKPEWGRLWATLCGLWRHQEQERVEVTLGGWDLDAFFAQSPEHLLMEWCQALLAVLVGRPVKHPLFMALRRAEPWESWLTTLPVPAALASATERMVWQLEDKGRELVCRVQKKSAKGLWSGGRQISYWDVSHQQCATAQDSQIAYSQNLDGGYYNSTPNIETLRLLAEHPYLQDGNGEPLSLQFTTPLLWLEESAEGWQASLHPAMAQNRYDRAQLNPLAPDLWQVVSIPPEVGQLMARLQQIPRLPEVALPRLAAALNQLPSLDWQGDHPALESHTRLSPWPGQPSALLNLQEDRLTLRLVSMLETSSAPRCPLGKGDAFIRDLSQPHHYWRRDLKQEQALARQVKKALGLGMGEGWEWQGASVIALLESLPAVLDPLGVAMCWHAASSRMLQADDSALRLRITGSEDWFRVEGELELDRQQVLDLRLLLRQLGGGQRYVTLDDDRKLLLSQALSERLQLLSALLDEEQEVAQKLAYPLLRLLQHTRVEGDKRWQALSEEWQRPAPCPPELLGPLRDYQRVGVQWLADLAQHQFGACLADDMGLGKTIQALTLLRLRQQAGPALVVMPTSLLANWREEAARFAPELRVVVLNEQSDRLAVLTDLGAGDLLLTTYGLLPSHKELADIRWATLIADEAQQIKNAGTVRAKALFALNGEVRLALSGTPVENHLGELWSLFNFINPGLLGNQTRFKQRFGKADRDPLHMAQLKAVIAPFVLRRLKREVLKELPQKTEIVHNVELSQAEKALYEAARREAVSQMKSGEGSALMIMLAQLTRLRRICCSPALLLPEWEQPQSKLDEAMLLIEEALVNEHRVLIFSQFVDLLTLLRARLEARKLDYCYLDGSCTARARQQAIKRFKSEPVPLFLISLKAGGTGLNLTEADTVIHLDPWWNPAVEDQASDRAHRIGQTAPVTVYRLVCEQTVEEKIVALHAQKRGLAEGVLGNQHEVAGLDADLLRSLLQS